MGECIAVIEVSILLSIPNAEVIVVGRHCVKPRRILEVLEPPRSNYK